MDVWSVVGKIGTLLAAGVAAISIWRAFFAKRHKVLFVVETIARPSPKTESLVDQFLREEVPRTLLYNEGLRKLGSVDSKGFEEIVRLAGPQAAEDLVGKLHSYRVLELPRELVRIELSNLGRKSARSIVIDVDFKYSMFETDSAEIVAEGKIFRMAELRPGQKVVLNLWRDFGYGTIRATHDDHVISVQKARKIMGWRAWLDEYILQPFMLFPLFICVMLLASFVSVILQRI